MIQYDVIEYGMIYIYILVYQVSQASDESRGLLRVCVWLSGGRTYLLTYVSI